MFILLNFPLLNHSLASAFLDLTPPNVEGTASIGRVLVRFTIVDAMECASIGLDRAVEDARQSKIMRMEGASDVTQVIDTSASRATGQSNLYKAVGELLSRIDAVKIVIDQLSEVSCQIIPGVHLKTEIT